MLTYCPIVQLLRVGGRSELSKIKCRQAIVFQDPYASLKTIRVDSDGAKSINGRSWRSTRKMRAEKPRLFSCKGTLAYQALPSPVAMHLYLQFQVTLSSAAQCL